MVSLVDIGCGSGLTGVGDDAKDARSVLIGFPARIRVSSSTVFPAGPRHERSDQ